MIKDKEGNFEGFRVEEFINNLREGGEYLRTLLGNNVKLGWAVMLPRGNLRREIESHMNENLAYINERITTILKREEWGVLEFSMGCGTYIMK